MKKKLKKNNICTMKAVNYFSNEVIRQDKGTGAMEWIQPEGATSGQYCVDIKCCIDAE